MGSKSSVALRIALAVFSFMASAGNDLKGVKLTSCRAELCTTLDTAELSQSALNPSLYAFESAKMNLVEVKNSKASLKNFEAGEGYYDSDGQVIVLRKLKNSKHRELIYNLDENKFVFFD